MKRIISAIVVFCLLTSVVSFANQSRIDSISIGDSENLGYPILNTQFIDSVYGVEDGDNMMYATATGQPAVFTVYNIDKGKVERTFDLPGGKASFSHAVDKDGNVYIATQTYSYLFKYSPQTKQLENLGEICSGETAMYHISFDEEGKLYIGTYPNAKLVSYDPKTKKFTDFGTVLEGEQYARSQVYKDGYVYVGGYTKDASFVRFNIKTKKVETLSKAKLVNDVVVNCYYSMSLHENYIITYAQGSDKKNYMTIFDIKTQKWLDDKVYEGYKGHFTSNEIDGRVYFTATGGIHSMDLKTLTIKKEDINHAAIFRGGKVITNIKGDSNLEGKKVLATADYYGGINLIDLENKQVYPRKITLPEQAAEIRSIVPGSYNNLWMGGYLTPKGLSMDLTTKEYKEFKIGQVEGIGEAAGKVYLGQYPGGKIFELDPKAQFTADKNPLQIGVAGNEQDRIFSFVDCDGIVAMGSVPDYNLHDGAITFYDPITQKIDCYKGIIKNHSIVSLVYENGILYGTTTVYGGLGKDPIESNAKLFSFDVKTKKIIKTEDIKIGTFKNNILHAGGIVIGEDGLLWGVSGGTVFAANKETLKIEKSIKGNEFEWKTTTPRWTPYGIFNAPNGMMVANIYNDTIIFDPKTLEFKKLFKDTDMSVLGSDNNIYVVTKKNTQLFKIPVAWDVKSAASVLNESLALFINKSVAIDKGVKKQVDKSNANVVPFTKENRTFVPLRFISESYGAEVEWNNETNQVTITYNGKVTTLTIGSDEMNVNGEIVKLDVPAFVKDGRTLLPLRAICEKVLGKSVFWDNRGLILISDKEVINKEADGKIIDEIVGQF